MNKILLLISAAAAFTTSCSQVENRIVPQAAEKVSMLSPTAAGSTHLISQGMNLASINAVIAGALPGDTVFVEQGTYIIDGKLALKPGIHIQKKDSQNPIFDATWKTSALHQQDYYPEDVDDCTISGITFWNMSLYIRNAKNVAFKWCIFDYGVKKAGTNKSTDLHDAYIRLMSAEDAIVSNCVFSRRAGNSGRGVWVSAGSTGPKVINNTFGNGGTTGYFITAINDNSESNSLISGNIIERTLALNAEDENTDHGIYAHSFNGLTIQNNTIKGWPANASGGAIKARNGQHLTIADNTFYDSGILLYIYVTPIAYQYFKYVEIKNNSIHIDSLVGGMYGGIGYWRQGGVTGIEESILIRDNMLPNGSISISASNGFNAASFNSAGGGVFDNDLHLPFLSLASGINQSGNR